MPDYQQGKIYTIRCRTDKTLIYVGSTIQPLYKRLHKHKCASKTEKTRLIYLAINGDWSNWKIELHELYPCNSKEELERREGEVIREIGTLNKYVAGRTHQEYWKEYYENNKEEQLKRGHIYYKENKEIKDEYWRKYREENKDKLYEKIPCECGCVISKNNINRHKQGKKHLKLLKTIPNQIVVDTLCIPLINLVSTTKPISKDSQVS